MRGCSKVEKDWIEPYVKELKEMAKKERLGKKSKFLSKRSKDQENSNGEENKSIPSKVIDKKSKLELAKEKFNQRKKIREKFNKII